MAILDNLQGNNIQGLTTTSGLQWYTVSEDIAVNDALFICTTATYGAIGTVRKLVNTSEEQATFFGFALTKSANTKRVAVLTGGSFEMDTATFATNTIYVASSTAGDLELSTDLTTGDFMSVVGASYNTTSFTIIGQYVGEVP